MSLQLINDYLAELDRLKKISGSRRETIVREAFKDLLKAWGRQQGLVFVAEYPVTTTMKTQVVAEGALLHELRVPLGYWEAKDERDDLHAEIAAKFKKGYPQDNIVFTDDIHAVLVQNREQVLRCDMTDTQALAKLLKLFFGFERPAIADFRQAVRQFKTDLPAVLSALRSMIESELASNGAFSNAAREFLAHRAGGDQPVVDRRRCARDADPAHSHRGKRVLDPYNEKKPKDPTIRALSDADRFADDNEKIIDLLARVRPSAFGPSRLPMR